MLLAAVVGSGIMAEQLAGGNQAIALLANTIATGSGLVALILTFGPVSGAHFNPAVTLVEASQGHRRPARRRGRRNALIPMADSCVSFDARQDHRFSCA
jgi:glycerol uptake facilitator-like aquaporin